MVGTTIPLAVSCRMLQRLAVLVVAALGKTSSTCPTQWSPDAETQLIFVADIFLVPLQLLPLSWFTNKTLSHPTVLNVGLRGKPCWRGQTQTLHRVL